jgi:hypothetical protein
MNFKESLIRNIKNIPGKKTKRKIVVIYVDDYGSIRVKDKEARQNLMIQGIPMDHNRYSRFDTLADRVDLELLFGTLTSVKDFYGNHACFTPFANIANPDFEKIRESGFASYYREPFTETLKRYGKAYDGVYDLWKQGISENIFYPAYHGTEHVNVKRFMQALQTQHTSTRLGFDNESVCLPHLPDEKAIKNASSTFDIDTASDNDRLREDIVIGMNMFENLLGYRSKQFTPGAGKYSPDLDSILFKNGIKYINVNRYFPYPMGDGVYIKKFLYNGKKTEFGQKYIVRNCVFEPTNDNGTINKGAAANCLLNIEAAFRWQAPAIISTHRVNFVGQLESSHRDESLKQLKQLLTEIVKKWPDVEFMNGDQMADSVFNQ